MKVAIRTDAEPRLGSGHAVRCLTLANELAAAGHAVVFLTRRMMPQLRTAIAAAGHEIVDLEEADDWTPPLGDEWDGERQRRDAAASISATDGCEWLVCDHYGLGRLWERSLRATGRHVLAIDDLGRRHDCGILLDQNYYAAPGSRYADGDAERLLVGPRYALLRPEFGAHRNLVAVRDGAVRRLFLCMGGADAANVTSLALDAIDVAGLTGVELDVVVGANHPALDELGRRCAQPGRRLHVQTGEMARLLAASDLAIGAGGTATWERCALGVPAIALEIAENQRDVVREGGRAGFLYGLEGIPSVDALALHLRCLAANNGLRAHLSATAIALVDGKGAARVAALLGHAGVTIRRAAMSDCADLHAWRNASEVRAVSRETDPIPLTAHEAWLSRALADPDRWLLVGEHDGAAVGVVRFDRVDRTSAEVSIYLVPGLGGGGWGSALLLAAEGWLTENVRAIDQVTAVVLGDNQASKRMFVRCGYDQASTMFNKRI